jgi:8-oxo-dGTP pyrophosphatase MutT (NUDIX family)
VSIFNQNVFDNIRTRVIVQSEDCILLCPPAEEADGWLCPGGGLEPNETLAECAVREVGEETGLQIDLQGIAFLREWVVPKYASPAAAAMIKPLHAPVASDGTGFCLEVFYYATTREPLPGTRPEHPEFAGFQWIPLERVPNMPVWPAELKWFCRRLLGGKPSPQISSFVAALNSPWEDLEADPFIWGNP